MIAKKCGSRWFALGSALLVVCMLGLSVQGCSGPVAKVNKAERKVDQAQGRVDTRVEDAGDKAGNKASEVERKANRVERIID